LSHINLLNNSI